MGKSSTAYGQKFTTLLNKIKRAHRADMPDLRDPITELIIGFLQWNASRRMAQSALTRIEDTVVDHNDLRVSHTDEIVNMIGAGYPQASERAARLHDSLQEIFAREHTLALDVLADKPKKEARGYLESLPGMTPYVAAHVTLRSFDGHAIPVDDRLADLLRHEQVVDSEADVSEITGFLERHILADSAPQAYAALKAWADAGTRRVSTGRTATVARKTGIAKRPTSKAGRSQSGGRRTRVRR